MIVIKIKIYCDLRSVGRFLLVSCPFWSRWPDVTFFWVTITFLFFHVGRPLWREDGSVICSAMTQVQFRVILRLSASSSWCGDPNGVQNQILFPLLANYFLSSRCRAPSPTAPTNRAIQPEVKVRSSVQWPPTCFQVILFEFGFQEFK
jgi:hypothetical protein